MPRYVVDTHALIWFFAKNPRLGRQARLVLLDPDSELVLPAIALAEALWIVSSRSLGVKPQDLLVAIDADQRISVHPLTREVVVIAQGLTNVPEMHDRQIVATSVHLSQDGLPCPILTRDEKITASGDATVVW